MFNYNPYQSYFNQPQQRQNTDERIWVQNQAGAEAYLLAPNSFVRLWDSSEPIFYEKKSDATGRPYPLEIYEYKRREPLRAPEAQNPNKSLYDEIEALKSRLSTLEEKERYYESNANNRTVQSVSEYLQRESSGRSAEAPELRADDTSPV